MNDAASPPSGGPRLLLGPALRHVGHDDATVWVETDRACEVEILGHRERTWSMAGHHYALVVLSDLPAGQSTDYDVRLDGQQVWPRPDDPRPQPRIRTIGGGAGPDRVRLLPLRPILCRHRRQQLRAGCADGAGPPAGQAGRGGLAARAADARRPGLRRRDHRGDPAADPAAARHHHRLEGAGGRLRGIHLALRRILDRPGRALADVGAAQLDDLRRPRHPRRLEHLPRLARGHARPPTGGPSG